MAIIVVSLLWVLALTTWTASSWPRHISSIEMLWLVAGRPIVVITWPYVGLIWSPIIPSLLLILITIYLVRGRVRTFIAPSGFIMPKISLSNLLPLVIIILLIAWQCSFLLCRGRPTIFLLRIRFSTADAYIRVMLIGIGLCARLGIRLRLLIHGFLF